MVDLTELTIKQAHEGLKSKKFTSVELTKAYLDKIKTIDKEINAYLLVDKEGALTQAEEADKKVATGEFGMLCGIPCSIKDAIMVEGQKCTAGSKILENYVAPYDATVIKKLKEQGAVILGKTNMDEFAMGGSTENSAFGVTRNPYDTSRVAGGSSGGSAASVAMDGALVALGSDTGGSIRQPASFCGLVGLKPTYGAVSRYGVMAMGSSLDQIGPLGKTVKDVEIIFDTIKGKDIHDGTTISIDTYRSERIGKNKPILGIPKHFLNGDGIDKNVLDNFNKTIEIFKEKGYEIKDIKLPNIAYSLAVYYVIMPAEASSNLARFDGVKYGLHKDGENIIDDYFETRGEGFGKEVRRRVLLGTYVLSSGYYDAYYNRANALRRVITEDFHKAFENVDIVLTPTTPAPAFKIGEKSSDPVAMYLEDIFTVTANLTGMPAMTIPSGFADKLPLGVQITARHGDERTLFEVGKDLLGE